MTKSQRIRKLFSEGISVRAIATVVGTTEDYVRLVVRGTREADKRYAESPKGRAAYMRKRQRYATDPEYREMMKERSRSWRSSRRRASYHRCKQKTPPSAELGGA